MTIEDKLITDSAPENIRVDSVKVGIRTIERFDSDDGENVRLIVSEENRQMSYPQLDGDENAKRFLDQIRPGDKFIQVEKNGVVRMLYGPLKEDSLYLPKY